jgi:beta-alanine--pyruvate transaminase
VFERALDEGILLRVTGDIISLAPPFISSEDEVRAMIESLRRTLRAIPAD